MTEIKIQFIDVGRKKFSDKVVFIIGGRDYKITPDDIAGCAYQEAKKHLLSGVIETTYDPEFNEGNIYAGFHHVGKFKVVE